MVWSKAELFDFHMSQFRAIESSRRARARYDKERADMNIGQGEVSHEKDKPDTAELYLDILGLSEDGKQRLRAQIASCYRTLDSRL